MEISGTSTQYLNYQALAQSGVTGVGAGQEVPGDAADTATSTLTATATSAASASGSTPATQFSSDMLAQLIQAQTDQAEGQTTDQTDSDSQQAVQGQGQGVHRGHHGHHGHGGGGGAQAAASTTDQTTATDVAGVTDPSLASTDQDQALIAAMTS